MKGMKGDKGFKGMEKGFEKALATGLRPWCVCRAAKARESKRTWHLGRDIGGESV